MDVQVIFESKPANTLFQLRASAVLSMNLLSGAECHLPPLPFPLVFAFFFTSALKLMRGNVH